MAVSKIALRFIFSVTLFSREFPPLRSFITVHSSGVFVYSFSIFIELIVSVKCLVKSYVNQSHFDHRIFLFRSFCLLNSRHLLSLTNLDSFRRVPCPPTEN